MGGEWGRERQRVRERKKMWGGETEWERERQGRRR